MTPQGTDIPEQVKPVFDAMASRSAHVDGLGPGRVDAGVLRVEMDDCEEDCWLEVSIDAGAYWVGWVSPDRYLSQSIEADLVYSGDDLDDLIDEELADQDGWSLDERLGPMEHFRDERKLFTFRSKTPLGPGGESPEEMAHTLLAALAAYAEAMRQLGDLKPDED